MTVAALMPFLESRAVVAYASVCDRLGLDPAAPFEGEDDVVLFNFRAAVALKVPVPDYSEPDERKGVVTDLDRQMRALTRG